MGFAGQVFAARVAIGLAMPSKQAMGQASQIIGAGAAALYKKMNGMQVQQAKKRTKQTETELNAVRSKIENHRKNLQSQMLQGQKKFEASMNKTNMGAKMVAGKTQKAFVKTQKALGTAKTTKQLENTFKAGKRAFQDFAAHVKQRSPDLFIKLFDHEDLEKAQREIGKFDMGKLSDVMWDTGKEGDKNRKELQRIAKLELDNATRRRDYGMEEIKMMRTKTEWLLKTGQIGADAHRESIALLDAEQQGFKDNVDAARNFYTFVDEGIRDYNQAYSEWDAEYQDMVRDEKDLTDLLTRAIKGEEEAIKELARGAEHAARKTAQFAEALKNNFQNALRESISALTAMFYKLQQNTQELVEFERELMNANSVFNLTRKELYETSNVITQFGQSFGLEMQNGAEGLYQLASAGLSANDAAKVLPETLKLSMAVQGDHNTIAKLTTQTIMGFGMEMEQAAEITDKFAHVIQKSLIEYEDLSSAVKFAMPFFTATGQSVDQLLGALEILTNRALEAGIAGRGLRQALAEFAEHADDNTAAFARMGLEIKEADGSMKDLTVIAKEYSDIIGPEAASNTELLTGLIEDLNVRGATAFVHLVQNADEFGEAVRNVENAGGELDEMVRIQNESMSAQIQILKNNVQMLFFMSDGVERANGAMNEFHSAIIDGITGFQDLLVEGEEGNKQLTEFGKTIQQVAVEAVRELTVLIQDGIKFLAEFSGEGKTAIGVLKAYLLPIKVLMKAIDWLGPRATSLVIQFTMLNKLFSLTAGLRATVAGMMALYTWVFAAEKATEEETEAVVNNITAKTTEVGVNQALAASELELAGARGVATQAATAEAGAEAAGDSLPVVGGAPPGMGGGGGVTPSMEKTKGGYKSVDKTGKKRYHYGKNAKKNAAKYGKAGKAKDVAKVTKTAGSGAAKVGKLAMALQAVYTAAGYAIAALGTMAGALVAIVVVIVAAIAAFVAWGVQLMGIWEPIKQLFVDFVEGIKSMTAALAEKMSGVVDWMVKIGLISEQTGQTIGYIGYIFMNMGEVAKDAMSELWWSIKKIGMQIAMMIGGTFGFMLYQVSEAFKNIYDIVMYYIGNSVIIDAIVDGFKGLWNKLFNSEDGWLRWLTPDYWIGKFEALSTWWNGGQVVLDAFSSAIDFGKQIWGGIADWWGDMFGEEGTARMAFKGFIDWFQDKWDALVGILKSPADILKQKELTEQQQEIADDYVQGNITKGEAMATQGGAAGVVGQAFYGSEGTGYLGTDYSIGGGIEEIGSWFGRTGGYLKGMQAGGRTMGNGAYIVGEAGPELFMPNQSGQVINNSRTNNILRNQLDAGVHANQANAGASLNVQSLHVGKFTAGRSKFKVDTFAGVA
jgi:TP901 family phage tail tape measure protein